MRTIILLALLTLNAIAGDPLKWKNNTVWCDQDGITYAERASCNHKIVYPYAYSKPPHH